MKMSCMVMMSPSMPTISEICVTLRVPSDRRLTWTTRLMALAICCRIAFSGSSRPAIEIIVSSRLSASRGVLACSVVSEPSWPVFIACSMSSASPPHLADDDPVGPHTQRVDQQHALGHLALAFDVGRAGLQPDHVGLLELELGRVLDGDDPLVGRDERRQDVEQRRLAGAGAAGDEDVEPGPHRRAQELEHRLGQAVGPQQVLAAQRVALELTDREVGAVDGQRLDDGVDAGAVGQAGVHHRRRFVDPAAHRRDDAVDDLQQVPVVLEPDVGLLQPAVALDEHAASRC